MTDIGEILAQADTACYHAKSLGGGAIQVYEAAHPALQKINDEMQWVGAITKAFEAHRFVLYRQLKVALSPAVTTQHYEILLRLRGEDGAIITPGEFLPAAERYGLAPSFDRWVIRNFFAYLDTHPEDEAHYAINLSGRSLSDPGTAEFILDEISQYNFDPARISFEVTETAAIDSLDACERLILTLQARGIQFALDDFGKGQSSFGYLKRLPVTCLKIDGEFVRGMNLDREKLAIVKAMHTLGQELGKQTIAEQVETEEELACLKAMGLDYVQGFLLHRPAPLPVDYCAGARTAARGWPPHRPRRLGCAHPTRPPRLTGGAYSARVGGHDRGFGIAAAHFVGARFDQAFALSRIQRQRMLQDRRQPGRIGERRQQAIHAILHQLLRPLGAGRHHQRAVRPGFQNDIAERLVHRCADKDIGQLVVGRRIVLPAGPVNARGDAEFGGQGFQFPAQGTVAHHQQMQRYSVERWRLAGAQTHAADRPSPC
jgi:EAL domain-containing protein (putative c-di-GMP-specific phosphodiesterase class I)